MNKSDIRNGIRRSWEHVDGLELGESFSNQEPFVPNESFRDICLDKTAKYEDIYLLGLREVQYNFVLSDLSYLQFGWSAESEVRYAYYPNPFIGADPESMRDLDDLREYVREGLSSADEYLHRASELRHTNHPPLTRYENSPAQYRELVHPCSHFHLGHHSENRWPVRRSLTPSAFTLIVVRNYYFHLWHRLREGLLETEPNPLDTVLEQERNNCEALQPNLFSSAEEKIFFFL